MSQDFRDILSATRDDKATDAGLAALEAYVLPLLEEARTAFEAEGVPGEIARESGPRSFAGGLPGLIFKCRGPERKNRLGVMSCPESVPAFFSCDGRAIYIGLGRYRSSAHPEERLGAPAPKQAEKLVRQAIERVLQSYFADLEDLRARGMWE